MSSYFPYPALLILAGVILVTVLTGCDVPTTEHQMGYQTASQRYERPTEEDPQHADHSDNEPSGELGSVTLHADQPESESLNHEHGSLDHLPAIPEISDQDAEALTLQQRVEELENENRRLRENSADRRSASALANSNHEEELYPSAVDELDTSSGEYQRMLTNHRKYLDRLLRAYQRKRRMFVKAEASYRVDHMMAGFKFMELLVTGTPKTFNTLPEKDIVAFNEFVDAAEDLSPELDAFLDEYSPDEIEDYEQLVELNGEIGVVLQMDEPTTGNRLLDYFNTLEGLGQEANRQRAYQSGGQQ